ncbi:dual OB domain-containing protein [Thermoleptolyngbya sp.]
MEIICLANSLKHGGRCVAGIEIETGQWVRPYSYLDSGTIPTHLTVIGDRPLQLLDVVDIPLAAHSRGYEVENRRILCQNWKRVSRVTPFDVVQYAEPTLLHFSQEDWISAVPFYYLKSLPIEQRRTIQLVKTDDFQVFSSATGKWKGFFSINRVSLAATITDPAFLDRLNAGYVPSCFCLVTLSFSQPWKKPESDNIQSCYRLIAGVIELFR